MEAGINEFIFIVGYLGEKIQDFVRQKYPQLTVHFVYQNERQGIGHAVLLTRSIVGEDEVFIVLGDTFADAVPFSTRNQLRIPLQSERKVRLRISSAYNPPSYE